VVLAHLLLGRNIFKGDSPEASRNRIMTMAIPDFRPLDSRIDDRLNEILHKAMTRDLAARYASADEMLYDLEHYIYHSGYGPTNETLGKFMRELFGQQIPSQSFDKRGDTDRLEHTARLRAAKS
jgi:serine/threonine-protein kinase